MSHVNAARARHGRRIHRSAAKLTHVAKVCPFLLIFAITSKISRIPTEHKESKDGSDS